MPVELQILNGGTGLVRKLSGHVAAEELVSSIVGFVASDEDVRRVRYSIFDSSEVDSMEDVGSEDIRAIAQVNERTARVNPEVLVAHISPGDAVFGRSRMWQALLEVSDVPWETGIFRSRAEADGWLKERLGSESNREP